MKSIRVNILSREYALRVEDDDEARMRRLARSLDERLRHFQEAHPEQAELTTAVITALALADELQALRETQREDRHALDRTLNTLADQLADALHEDPAEP